MASSSARLFQARTKRGAALVTALAVSLTLASFSILILRHASDARFQTRRASERVLAEAALESTFAELLLRIEETGSGDMAIRYGETVSIDTERGPVEAVFTSPSGRVDLNTASPLLFAALAEAAGADAEAATALGDAIADWRDGDDLTQLNGAERDAYLAAGIDGPANRPFRAVEELRGVLGMEEALYACLATQVTIATGATSPDLAHASPWLRAALGLGETDALLPPIRLVPGEVYGLSLVERAERRFGYRLDILFRPSGDPADPVWVHNWQVSSAGVEQADNPCPPPRNTAFEGGAR